MVSEHKVFLGNNTPRKFLITGNTNITRFYGLPKIHKGNSLSPVVSCFNTPTYFLAKTFKTNISDVLANQNLWKKCNRL